MKDERHLVLQTIDAVDDVIILLQLKSWSILGAINRGEGSNLCLWVYFKEVALKCLHLGLTYRKRCGGQLAVDVGHGNAVGVNNREMNDSRAHQCFGHPTAYAAHAENYSAKGAQALLDYSYGKQLKDIFPPLLLSAVMGAVVWCVSLLHLAPVWTLCIQIPLGVVFYTGAAWLLKMERFFYIKKQLENVLRKSSRKRKK